MTSPSNQRATDGVRPTLDGVLTPATPGLTRCAVQESNLQPTASGTVPQYGFSPCAPDSAARKAPENSRTLGEGHKAKDNRTAIHVPSVYDRTPARLLFLVRGFV